MFENDNGIDDDNDYQDQTALLNFNSGTNSYGNIQQMQRFNTINHGSSSTNNTPMRGRKPNSKMTVFGKDAIMKHASK